MSISSKDMSKRRMTFDTFKTMATNTTLSNAEKIGFPDNYRDGFEKAILEDISTKLILCRDDISILDVGCGCGQLTKLLIEQSIQNRQNLYLLDSQEMLDNISCNNEKIFKIHGKFPSECKPFINEMQNQFDGILIYSVLQHIFLDDNIYSFIDHLLGLLKPGGRLLLGDIPNISKRNRFFISDRGIRLHQEYTNSKEIPVINFQNVEIDKIDDGVLIGILYRYRNFGFECYLMPQDRNLPLETRREDILIVKH